MKPAIVFLVAASAVSAQMRVMTLPGKSPVVTFRIVFTAGAERDPVDKPGLAYLTANLLANGSSAAMTHKQIADAMFPMAASVNVQVDQEMVTFSGATHTDNLNEYYSLLRGMLLDPGWREEDFERVRRDAINFLKVSLRGNNDEELGKEVLIENIFTGTPYGHYAAGTVRSIEKITLDDVKSFYRTQYNQSALILGIAGGYPPAFFEKVKADFRRLPQGPGFRPREKMPEMIHGNRVVVVDKDTRSVAYSIGFPIAVTRKSVDYPALLLAASYFGQHRMSGGVLYDEMREKRGLNYGDYAYIEYFPRGMFLMEPPPNVARRHQIFQMWVRPVEPANAKFALRLALYELDRLVKNGIPEDGFERTRDFLIKYVNVLLRTKSAEIGYGIDSLFYDAPRYNEEIRSGFAKVTRDEVNRVIKRYLRADRLVIVAVSKNGAELKRELASNDPSPMKYNSPKPAAIVEEDKVVEKWPLNLRPEDITVVPVGEVFQ
jgi:zinc protease